jgi:hypothetical protein
MGGIQKARMAANRVKCANNLRQIGSVLHQYDDATGTLPRARYCPDKSNGTNPECKNIQPDEYTGPNETWWAPFDNRPGFDMTRGAGDENYQHGPLWSFLEGRRESFQCPDGLDPDPASPTFGKRFQVSYAMNYVTNGPSGLRMVDVVNGNGSSNVMLVWDHTKSPACSTLGWPRTPCQPYIDGASPHYLAALPAAARQRVQRALLRRPRHRAAAERDPGSAVPGTAHWAVVVHCHSLVW